MIEFLFEVVARFVGVSFAALFRWCSSGFRKGYRAEWRRLFDKYSGSYEWIDVLGIFVVLSCIAGIGWIVYTCTKAA